MAQEFEWNDVRNPNYLINMRASFAANREEEARERGGEGRGRGRGGGGGRGRGGGGGGRGGRGRHAPTGSTPSKRPASGSDAKSAKKPRVEAKEEKKEKGEKVDVDEDDYAKWKRNQWTREVDLRSVRSYYNPAKPGKSEEASKEKPTRCCRLGAGEGCNITAAHCKPLTDFTGGGRR